MSGRAAVISAIGRGSSVPNGTTEAKAGRPRSRATPASAPADLRMEASSAVAAWPTMLS